MTDYTPLPFDSPPAPSGHSGKQLTPADMVGYPMAFAGTYGYGLRGPNHDFSRDKFGAALASTAVVAGYRATFTIATTTDATEYWIKSKATGEIIARSSDPDPLHPLARAIRNAQRKRETSESLFKLWSWALNVTGMNFVERLPNSFGEFVDLEWLNPLAVSLQITTGRISQFNYNGLDKSVSLPWWRVAYDRYITLTSDYYGISPMQVAMDALNIDRNMKRSILAFYRNNARPDMLISPVRTGGSIEEDQLDDEEVARWQAALRAQTMGVDNEGSALVSPYPVSVETFEQQKIEHLVELMREVKSEVYEAYGVPPAIAGNPDNTRYQNSPENAKVFNRTMFNHLRHIEGSFNTGIVPVIVPQEDCYLEFDKAQFVTMTESEQERRRMAAEDYDGGRITLNAYLKATNQPAVPDGDVYKLSAGSIFVPAGQLGQMQPASPLMQPGNLLGAPSPFNAAAPVEDEPYNTDSFCVMLKFGAQAALIDLQDKLRRLYAGSSITWNEPDDFHVTVLYVPRIEDAQVDALAEALNGIDVPEMALRIGSVATFDNVGSHALHFRVRTDSDLLAFQRDLYELATDAGCSCSPYSEPSVYKPHVTMGYSDSKLPRVTFDGKLSVTPVALVVTRGDETLLERALGEVITLPANNVADTLAEQDDELAELRAWRKKAENNYRRAVEGFDVKHMPEDIHAWVLDGLRAANGDKAAIRAVFTRAAELLREEKDARASFCELWRALRMLDLHSGYSLAVDPDDEKTWTSTAAEFSQRFRQLLQQASQGDITEAVFGGRMSADLRKYGMMALRDGMLDAGYNPESLSAAEQRKFSAWARQQFQYALNLRDELYGRGLTDLQIDQRVRMWTNISLREAYLIGVTLGAPEKRYRWKLNPAEHCDDCPRLDGQVHTVSDWLSRRLYPGSGRTSCRQGCKCSMVETDEPERGNFI